MPNASAPRCGGSLQRARVHKLLHEILKNTCGIANCRGASERSSQGDQGRFQKQVQREIQRRFQRGVLQGFERGFYMGSQRVLERVLNGERMACSSGF